MCQFVDRPSINFSSTSDEIHTYRPFHFYDSLNALANHEHTLIAMGGRMGGADWSKINNLVFIDLVLHYSQKDLDLEQDEPNKEAPTISSGFRKSVESQKVMELQPIAERWVASKIRDIRSPVCRCSHPPPHHLKPTVLAGVAELTQCQINASYRCTGKVDVRTVECGRCILYFLDVMVRWLF